ncbi:pleckstrin homology domain-containing family S member 1-like [Clarias gariepinus]
MFSKFKKTSAHQNSKFYLWPANGEEVMSGYLYKSPPKTLLLRSVKSWKRRYFVLSKTPSNEYQLKFFKDENNREKPQGQINLYQVSLFFQNPDSHPLWLWIQRNFRCSASCVLYMRVQDRDYFLIGENSEIDDWFNAIFKVLNTHPTPLPDSEEMRKLRSISEPTYMPSHDNKWSGDQEKDSKSLYASVRQSACLSDSHYDYPRNYMMAEPQFLESDSEEDDEMNIDKESQTEEPPSPYMDMESVLKGNKVPENSSLLCGEEAGGSAALNLQNVPGSEKCIPVKKEICISKDEMKNGVIFLEEGGRLCVSNCRQTLCPGLFHEGDQILAINDLLTDSLPVLQTYLKRISKDQVKLTILRQPGSQPLGEIYT